MYRLSARSAFIWTVLAVTVCLFLTWQYLDTGTMAPNKAALIVPALKKQTATVIMAHGLGDRLVRSLGIYKSKKANSCLVSGAGW